MSYFLPKEVQEGLEMARMADLKKKSRLRVQVGDEIYPVLRLWHDGFALDAEHAPHLRGLVDLLDGTRHPGKLGLDPSSAGIDLKGALSHQVELPRNHLRMLALALF